MNYPAISISRHTRCSTIPGRGLSRDDKLLVGLAMDAYGYLLPQGDHAWADLAAAIEVTYSLDEPRNAAVHEAVLRCDAAYSEMLTKQAQP